MTYSVHLRLMPPLAPLLPVFHVSTRHDTASNQRPALRNPPASATAAGPPPFWPAAVAAHLVGARRFHQLQESQGPSQGPASRQSREAFPCSSPVAPGPSQPTAPVTVRFAPRFARQGFRLPVPLWVLKPQVETSPTQRIAQTTLFVGTQHDEGDGLRSDRPELRQRHLPGAQDFEQHRFERLVHFVGFIDQQRAGPVTTPQSSQQRPLGEELQRMQALADVLPVLSEPSSLGRKEQILQGFVELADGLLFRDPLVAL